MRAPDLQGSPTVDKNGDEGPGKTQAAWIVEDGVVPSNHATLRRICEAQQPGVLQKADAEAQAIEQHADAEPATKV